MFIILLGPPGSGKGTQAKLLCDNGDYVHLSTGDILRQAVLDDSPLGKKANQYIKEGKLIPDDTMINCVTERISYIHKKDAQQAILLDGFPRTISQAQMLGKVASPHCILDFQVPWDILKNRLLIRAQEEGRSDDTTHVMKKRFSIYEEEIHAIRRFYHDKKMFHSIDGVGDVHAIHKAIVRSISASISGQ